MPDVALPTRLVDPASLSAEPFRSLQLALQLRHSGEGGPVCVVTGAERDIGKSTIASNLALVAAAGGSRVLLVDADIRRPILHDLFGIPRAPGLIDFLATGKDVRGFLRRGADTPPTLDVVTAGRPVANIGDITAWPRLGSMLREAAAAYDLVVVDTAPVLLSSDTEAIAGYSSAEVLMVIGPNSRRRSIVSALRRLDLMDAKVAGLVLNREGQLVEYGY